MPFAALARGASWLLFATLGERLLALLQTVLVARALGIHDYGVYGLVVGTIGFVAGVAGLQLGLTATVFVARHRETDKQRAADVVALTIGAGWALAVLPIALASLAGSPIALWLFDGRAGGEVVVLGAAVVAFSIIGGVQDGVLQGFEDFRSGAIARVASAVATTALVHPAADRFGVAGAILVIAVGAGLRAALLQRRIAAATRAAALPKPGACWRSAEVLWRFSLPSVLASVLSGFVAWWGILLLSRGDFSEVAFANVGQQWRGPILLMAGLMSTVAIPRLSRHFAQDEHAESAALSRAVLRWTLVGSVVAAGAIALASVPIMSIYGPGFAAGELAFAALVASSVPQVLCGVHLQQLVARGAMWTQLAMYGVHAAVSLACYAWLIETHKAFGYSLAVLAGWTAMLGASAVHARRTRSPS